MIVTTGIHLSVLSIKKRTANFKLRLSTRKRLDANQQNPKQEQSLRSYWEQRDTFCTVSRRFQWNQVLQKCGKNMFKQYSLSRVAERFGASARGMVTPRELYNKVDEMVDLQMLCRMSISEVVQMLVRRTWKWIARKRGLAQTNDAKSKELAPRLVNNLFRPPNRTIQEKVVGSRSDCHHEDRNKSLWTAADLSTWWRRMERHSRQRTFAMWTSLSRYCWKIHGRTIFGFIGRRSGPILWMEKGESQSLVKYGKITGASQRTMCHLWQFHKNLVFPTSQRRRRATDCKSSGVVGLKEKTPDEMRLSSDEESTDLPVFAERSEGPNTKKNDWQA